VPFKQEPPLTQQHKQGHCEGMKGCCLMACSPTLLCTRTATQDTRCLRCTCKHVCWRGAQQATLQTGSVLSCRRVRLPAVRATVYQGALKQLNATRHTRLTLRCWPAGQLAAGLTPMLEGEASWGQHNSKARLPHLGGRMCAGPERHSSTARPPRCSARQQKGAARKDWHQGKANTAVKWFFEHKGQHT
jgi:hypothetical protein